MTDKEIEKKFKQWWFSNYPRNINPKDCFKAGVKSVLDQQNRRTNDTNT